MMPSRPACIAVLGGSFDPVHQGHVALAEHFARLLAPDLLRIVPAGNPWQKAPLHASASQRVDMLRLAFAQASVPVLIDTQEIERHGPSYTIDTLRAIRAELVAEASVAFLMGADQLRQLHTWKDWRRLFDYAHVCAASRPGFAMEAAQLPLEVAQELERRAGTPEQVRSTPHGFACVTEDLAMDIAATGIREALARGETVDALVPGAVLDYIQLHQLYRH